MDSIREVFAYRLREIREKSGMTQESFAEKLKMSKRTYQNMESGSVPQQATMAHLVRKLGLPSETPLFLDPDLVPKNPAPTPAEALEVLAKAIQAPVAPKEHLIRLPEGFNENQIRFFEALFKRMGEMQASGSMEDHIAAALSFGKQQKQRSK